MTTKIIETFSPSGSFTLAQNVPYHYLAHGLHIASELLCPELQPIQANHSKPDVVIRFGEVLDELVDYVYDDGFSQMKPGAYLLKLDGIAKFLVTDGSQIVIQAAVGCPHEVIRLYLFSQGFGTLLHQRGRLILHASAIECERGAVLFVGPSGSGKSTLAASFMKAGYRLFTGDLCAIELSSANGPQVFPGFAQIRLWHDVVRELGYDRHAMQRVWHKEDKYTYMLQDELASHPSRLHAIYLLNPADVEDVSVDSLTPGERFSALMLNIFRAEYVKGLGVQERLFRQVSQLLRYSQVKRVTRPRDHFSIRQLIQRLEEEL